MEASESSDWATGFKSADKSGASKAGAASVFVSFLAEGEASPTRSDKSSSTFDKSSGASFNGIPRTKSSESFTS